MVCLPSLILITKRHIGSNAFIGTAKPFNTAPHLMVSVKVAADACGK